MSELPKPKPPPGPRGAKPQASYKSSYGRDSGESITTSSSSSSARPNRFTSRHERSRGGDKGPPRHLHRGFSKSNARPTSTAPSNGSATSSSNSVAIGNKRSLPPSEPRGYRDARDSVSTSGTSRQPQQHAPSQVSLPTGPSNKSEARSDGPPTKRPRSDSYDTNDSIRGRARHRRRNIPVTSCTAHHPLPGRRPDRPSNGLLKELHVYSIKIKLPLVVYKRVQQVGEGTYGKVYKAQNILTHDFVALKKLRLESEREGFPITAMREIKLLQSFDHPNVVSLLEMMVEHNQIFMVFDYLDHDLTGLLTHPQLKLNESHRKYIFKQLMEGLNYLHKKHIIHRDIKGSNILLDSMGKLKIADFGLARTMKQVRPGESPDYTNRVITIWYRPPELLLGATDYGREVDIWGVGCLLVELYSKVAVFQGGDELGQLSKIFNIMGTPSISGWPTIENLPWFEMLKPKVNIAGTFSKQYKPMMLSQSFDLAMKLLALNPQNRLSTLEALRHSYFTSEPKPEPLLFLKDIKGEWHEFETKQQRRKERKRLHDEATAQQQQQQKLKIKEQLTEGNNGGGSLSERPGSDPELPLEAPPLVEEMIDLPKSESMDQDMHDSPVISVLNLVQTNVVEVNPGPNEADYEMKDSTNLSDSLEKEPLNGHGGSTTVVQQENGDEKQEK